MPRKITIEISEHWKREKSGDEQEYAASIRDGAVFEYHRHLTQEELLEKIKQTINHQTKGQPHGKANTTAKH